MLPRMAIPLLVCGVVYLQGGALASADLVYYVLFFYFVSLLADTWLSVACCRDARDR